MIRWVFCFLILSSFSSLGQLKLLPISNFRDGANARTEAFSDTLSLPFWDDFSMSHIYPDSTLWQTGRNVFVNNSLPVRPPSLYAASFDGVDEFGNPYNTVTTFNGAGDSLVTHPINLKDVPTSRRSTVFLSFYWQLLGNGDLPEESDSLGVYFLDTAGIWISQDLVPSDLDRNALIGGRDNLNLGPDSVQNFRMVMIPVRGERFYHPGFKIKFVSYSNLNGIYDSWHIDYVYLNQDRSASRTTFYDRTISAQPALLFAPYHELPVRQYLADPGQYALPQFTRVNNLDNSFHPLEYYHRMVNLTTNQEVTTGPLVNFRLDPLEIGRKINGLALDPSIVQGDSIILLSEFVYNTGDQRLFEVIGSGGDTLFLPVDLRTNDTIRQYYTLHEHMAYDDGVADFAAGINIISGQLAVQYVLNEPDTLTGVQINFPTISPSTEGLSIDIIVWVDLTTEGQAVQWPYTVTTTDRTSFVQVDFSTPIYLIDTFYVGFKQYTENYVGIGFDKDNTMGTGYIYSNTNREWVRNERLEGSLMIRPVFSQSDFVLGTNELQEPEILLFPNPNNGILNISGNYDLFEIHNLSGQVVHQGNYAIEIDISHLTNGLYFCRFVKDNQVMIRKLILNK